MHHDIVELGGKPLQDRFTDAEQSTFLQSEPPPGATTNRHSALLTSALISTNSPVQLPVPLEESELAPPSHVPH